MSEPLQYNTGSSLLANVMSNVNEIMGGEASPVYAQGNGGGATGGTGGMPAGLSDLLSELADVLDRISQMIGGDQGGSGAPGGSTSSAPTGSGTGGEPIAGSGRIWGDPHFIGQDGGKYDVQGEAGKTYNLLSDQNFQMNGRFDDWGNGATAVGAVGISAGSDQVEVNKDGTVMVNGDELKEGDSVQLADGGTVSYNDGEVSIDSGEWKTDIQFAGSGDKAHLNIDVSTENAVADGVKPHGLLGQTFDADDDARNGDKGKGAQGGGAIEGSNGNITNAGDKSAVENYEVDGLYDRNFEDFNQFFDPSGSTGSGGWGNEAVDRLMAQAFASVAQSMLLFSQSMQNDALS